MESLVNRHALRHPDWAPNGPRRWEGVLALPGKISIHPSICIPFSPLSELRVSWSLSLLSSDKGRVTPWRPWKWPVHSRATLRDWLENCWKQCIFMNTLNIFLRKMLSQSPKSKKQNQQKIIWVTVCHPDNVDFNAKAQSDSFLLLAPQHLVSGESSFLKINIFANWNLTVLQL